MRKTFGDQSTETECSSVQVAFGGDAQRDIGEIVPGERKDVSSDAVKICSEGLFTQGASEKFHQYRCLRCDAEGASQCHDAGVDQMLILASAFTDTNNCVGKS